MIHGPTLNGFSADSFLVQVVLKASSISNVETVTFKFIPIVELEALLVEVFTCMKHLDIIQSTKLCWEHRVNLVDVNRLFGTLHEKSVFIGERILGLKALRERFPTQYSCTPFPSMNGIAIGV
tara:strand:- start:1772 stop:2140 length:369 start_codon:yes stop_codon:yes gene_type:complete